MTTLAHIEYSVLTHPGFKGVHGVERIRKYNQRLIYKIDIAASFTLIAIFLLRIF